MINYFRCTVDHQLYSETLKFDFNVLAAGYNSIKIQMPCIKVRFLIAPQELHNKKQAASRTPAHISEHQQHCGQIWRMQWDRNSNLSLQASLLIMWQDQWKLLLSEMCVFNGKSVYEKKITGSTSMSSFLLKSAGNLGAASGTLHTNRSCKEETKKRVKQLSNDALRQSSSEHGHDFSYLMRILISFLNKLTLCQKESQRWHITPLGCTGWPGNGVGYKKYKIILKFF